MTVINTNIKALYTQSALKVNERGSAVAMQQLATGKRINSSKDDAAGLAIAARMTQNILGLGQSIRNAGDAISMIQTAEGATQEITVMLQRMSELAVQSANSTYSSDQRSYLDQEFQQLKQEIIRVSEMHEWNGFPILNGKAGTPVGLPTTATAIRAGVAATASGKVEPGAVAQVSQISITSPKDVVTSTLAGTYIEFADMGTATESLSIPNYNGYDGGSGPASVSGALSFQNVIQNGIQKGILYRGDGTNPIAIGSVDSNLNGTDGKPLRINLGYVLSDEANQFFNPANQHFYEVVTPSSAITWQQAKDLAQSRSLFSLNGYLATVTDASEQSFINGQLAGKQGWIGASDQDVSLGGLGEGNWAWLTGPEAGTLFYKGDFNNGSALASKFANWSYREPNNSGNEDYAYILWTGQWNDYLGSSTVDSYVVEYGGGGAFGTYAAPTLTPTDLQNIRARVIYSDSAAYTDTASVTINGQSITSAPTLRGGESIATALETAINARISAGTLQNVMVQRYGNTLNLQSTVPGTAFDLSAASTNHSGNTISAQTVIDNKTAGTKALETGDLEIQTDKGSYAIPASIAAADPKSNTFASSSSAAASAIAIAAAINSKTGDTGVIAIANGATITGSKTTVNANAVQTDLYVNGTQINLSLTSGQTESARRQYVMNSINAKTSLHGVVAGDSGNGGLTLTTNDGRNLSVWYDASVAIGSDFGLGENKPTTSDPAGVTGVATAATAAITNKTITSLSTSTTSKDIAISSTVGLVVGMAVSGAGIPTGATITSVTASSITLSATPTANATTLTFTGGVKASTVYGTVDLNSAKEFNIVAGQNASPTDKTTTTSNQFKFTGKAAATVGFSYNGKSGTYASDSSSPTTAANFATAVNTLAGTTVAYTAASHANKSAVATSGTVIVMTDTSGLVPGMKVTGSGIAGSTTIASISGSNVTLSQAVSGTVSNLTSVEYPAGADTVYIPSSSGVSFTAPSSAYKPAMSLVSGTTGYTSTTQVVAVDPNNSNISSLGFIPGAVKAKNIGLLNFQVGPAANQLISIELPDFGKNGDVTGPITSDKAPTNLLTVQSANDVIMNVNKSLDRIAATRATMGAVMNRLTHVIDNLTNVVMNSEASRSQIEDAEYAQASTELAKTQIKQQAATAVLAQANLSSQMVLKLLEQN